MGKRVRKKPPSPWDLLSWEEHEEAQAFVERHPDGSGLDEIGLVMGVTGERVRQIYERAIAKLRAEAGVHVDPSRIFRVRAVRAAGRQARM
jgi:hypothetical protein